MMHFILQFGIRLFPELASYEVSSGHHSQEEPSLIPSSTVGRIRYLHMSWRLIATAAIFGYDLRNSIRSEKLTLYG